MKKDRPGIIFFHHFLPWYGSIQKLMRSEKPDFKPSEIPWGFMKNQRCQELEWKNWKPRTKVAISTGCLLAACQHLCTVLYKYYCVNLSIGKLMRGEEDWRKWLMVVPETAGFRHCLTEPPWSGRGGRKSRWEGDRAFQSQQSDFHHFMY